VARRSFTNSSWTPTPVLDSASFTAQGFMAMAGGAATQATQIWEVFMGGATNSSAPMLMQLARDSTVGATLTGLGAGQSDGPLDVSTAALALPVLVFTAATTEPQRAATLARLTFPFNANGGVVRWYAGDEHGTYRMYGLAVNIGEVSLSAYSGGTAGLMGSHIIYETL
jgi:hypothetical protein